MMQEPFLYALLQASKAHGLHTTLDTSGYACPKAMQHIAPLVDLFLYDVKIVDENLHRKFTGVSNKTILENLKFLFDSEKQVILRFPVIPGITDTPENIHQIKEIIPPTPNLQINLLPYHSIAKEKYRRFCKNNKMAEVQDLRREDLLPLKDEFEQIGLQVFIGG